MPRGVSWPRARGTGGDRAGIFRTATGILARDVSPGRLVAETSRGAHANFARIPEKVKQGTPSENAPDESLRVTEKLLHGQGSPRSPGSAALRSIIYARPVRLCGHALRRVFSITRNSGSKTWGRLVSVGDKGATLATCPAPFRVRAGLAAQASRRRSGPAGRHCLIRRGAEGQRYRARMP